MGQMEFMEVALQPDEEQSRTLEFLPDELLKQAQLWENFFLLLVSRTNTVCAEAKLAASSYFQKNYSYFVRKMRNNSSVRKNPMEVLVAEKQVLPLHIQDLHTDI